MVKKFDIERINNINEIQDVEELKIFYFFLGALNEEWEAQGASPYSNDLEVLESMINELGGF